MCEYEEGFEVQSHRGVVRNEVFGVSEREEKVRLQCGEEKRSERRREEI